MRILLLSRYGRLGASSRLRSYQYLPYLEAYGFRVTVAPLFSDSYVATLQQGDKDKIEVARAFGRRVYHLLGRKSFDLLWIEKECLPWIPSPIERLLLAGGPPFVLDYDDAIFHKYDHHPHIGIRQLLGAKIQRLMAASRVVIAGNEYLAEYARAAKAPQVELLPTVVDLARYPQEAAGVRLSGPPTVGWIGQRSTAHFLEPLSRVFQTLAEQRIATLRAIGIDSAASSVRFEPVPWTEETEVSNLCELDIGIMPLHDEPFERGKCGYKLIQYMACGLPVVASPVGVNSHIVEDGVTGFLASTEADWMQALSKLARDPALRTRMGSAGRTRVEREFSTAIAAPRLASILLSSLSDQGPRSKSEA